MDKGDKYGLNDKQPWELYDREEIQDEAKDFLATITKSDEEESANEERVKNFRLELSGSK